MPEWAGAELEAKRKQALEALRSSMSEMLDHKEWVQLTEMLWQSISDKVIDAQLDVIRRERFEPKSRPSSTTATDRLDRFTRYKRVLRALNFMFKCVDIDWAVFLRTVVDLVEGRVDVNGLDSPARRDQQDRAAAETVEGTDDSGSRRQV